MTYTSIRPGKEWLDTNGKPIQAHGFSVFHKDGTWYCWTSTISVNMARMHIMDKTKSSMFGFIALK